MATSVKSTIRVLIADDHAIVRRGLVSIINDEPDLVIVGEFGNGLEALQHYEELVPDVVLMDLAMPILDGTSAMVKILEKDSKPKSSSSPRTMKRKTCIARCQRARGDIF